jgi:hypothetical protein
VDEIQLGFLELCLSDKDFFIKLLERSVGIFMFLFERVDRDGVRDELQKSRIFTQHNNLIRFDEDGTVSLHKNILHFVDKLHNNNLLSEVVSSLDYHISHPQAIEFMEI